ncbi:MAG: glycosyltransferase family A protein [Alphaproteobacteria bacterium]|nr:glycosyltransferase family A protein [Alphaproteobacteria bacterium]
MLTYDVVVPAWNAEATIAHTLESILAQTIPPDRVIVIDDGSTDGTVELARSVGVEVISQRKAGPGAATTRGLAMATATVVAMLDADDLWLPQKMERQLAVLSKATGPTAVTTLQREFRHGHVDDGRGEIRSGLNRSSLVLPLALARQVGPVIDPEGGRGDMVDWLRRVRASGILIREIDEVLVLRRIIAGSFSYGRDPLRDRGYIAVAYEALRARRRTSRKP